LIDNPALWGTARQPVYCGGTCRSISSDLFTDLPVSDPDGAELPDLAAARENALKDAQEILAASLKDGRLELRHYIRIRDEVGEIVAVVHFEEALKIIPRSA